MLFNSLHKELNQFKLGEHIITMPEYFRQPMQDTHGFLTREQVKKFLSVIVDTRDIILFTLLANSGRRIEEIVRNYGIRPCDIIVDDGVILFVQLKKNPIHKKDSSGKMKTEEELMLERELKERKRRPIPIDQYTMDMLLSYIKDNGIKGNELIFDISRQRAHQLCRHYSEIADVKLASGRPMHCHVFRHSYAMHLADKTGNQLEAMKTIQHLLGHSDINMTSFYLHYKPKQVRKLMNQFFNDLKD